MTEVRGGGRLDDSGPCVVLATPSMLQSGLSRELFDAWCEDPRNGIVICDFAVQGTLAREIQSSPSHVITKAGAKVWPIPCLHQALWLAVALKLDLLPALQHSCAATPAAYWRLSDSPQWTLPDTSYGLGDRLNPARWEL